MLTSAVPVLSSASTVPRVKAVVIAADRTVPQPACTTIRWTAGAAGGEGPYEFKWLVFNGSEWQVAQNWSDSNTFAWRPAFANIRYRVAVWVRGFGNRRDEFYAMTEAAFAIEAGVTPSQRNAQDVTPRTPFAVLPPVSTVMLATDLPSPQQAGTAITFSASATGGGIAREYKWFVYDGNRWRVAAPWSTINTFVWRPPSPNHRWRVSVWARSAGSTSDYFEACSEIEFAIQSASA